MLFIAPASHPMVNFGLGYYCALLSHDDGRCRLQLKLVVGLGPSHWILLEYLQKTARCRFYTGSLILALQALHEKILSLLEGGDGVCRRNRQLTKLCTRLTHVYYSV